MLEAPETDRIVVPKRSRGRPTPEANARYTAAIARFCARVKDIQASLDFEVSARGWCYILEEHGATKADFGAIQSLFTDCRKSGDLPLDICAEDEARAADHIESVTDETPDEFVQGWIEYVRDDACDDYNPISLWNSSDYYLEMWVEKIDLKSLFSDICKRYTIPLINIRGRTCLNSRAGTMRRFRQRERQVKQCVLLYCGDHDPSGLQISDEIRSDMESLSGATEYSPDALIIDRFGLNAKFINRQRLSWTHNLITSSGGGFLADEDHSDHHKPYVQNYIAQFGVRKVEANALVVRPEAGRRLCRNAIRQYIPDNILTDFEARREVIRQRARARAAVLELPKQD